MANVIEVKVPDIGGFKDVPVIEVLVKPGDAVKPEDSLLTLESDKATMEVPSPAAGVVKELKIKVGDKVSEGSLVLTLESAGDGAANPPSSPPLAKGGDGRGGGAEIRAVTGARRAARVAIPSPSIPLPSPHSFPLSREERRSSSLPSPFGRRVGDEGSGEGRAERPCNPPISPPCQGGDGRGGG